MDEVFPVLAGVVLGLAIHAIGSKGVRAVLIAVFSLGFGAVASWISGELAISVVYVAIDAAQVTVAAVLTAVLAAAWRWRALRVRA
jgi:hypothetical protein